MARIGLFDVIRDVSFDKKYRTADQAFRNECLSAYRPVLVNKYFSFALDTLIDAEMMNANHRLDRAMQIDYMSGSIHKRKRYIKWQKSASRSELIAGVSNEFEVNTKQAEYMVACMSESQRAAVEERYANDAAAIKNNGK